MQLPSLLAGLCSETFLILGALCLITIYVLRRRTARNFPPGPRGLPIVGYAPFLGDNGAETMRKMKRKYGPVMSIQMGMEDWVVLNDFDSIYECLVKKGEKFSGRPRNEIFDMFTEGLGVAMIDYGKTWKDLRKFGFRSLRGFGFGKKAMEENVVEEIPYLLKELTKNDGKSHSIKITNAVSNIICRVTFGSRFEYDDETFNALIKSFREFYTSSVDYQLFGIMTAVPILRHFPIFRGSLKRSVKIYNTFTDILHGFIKEHQKNFDQDDIRDFIDAFLAEMNERGPNDESFHEEQLAQYVRDLFEAGTETTSSTLVWGILAMLHYPECQDKIANEIQDVLGDSGIPSTKLRDQMNYTCAFIHELMRHRTLVPTSVMHKTTETATINGYVIPKDTTIIPNIWAVHYDPELFENPEEFKPERFLNEDGKFVKPSHVIPFSVGPRHCLGEHLARMEIFIFLTGILQKLMIVEDPANPPPPLTAGVSSFLSTYAPPDFKVLFKRR